MPLETLAGVKRVHVDFDIVKEEIPIILGMVILHREELVADIVYNCLKNRAALDIDVILKLHVDDCFITFVRLQSRHSYVPIDLYTSVKFTRVQLQKLQRGSSSINLKTTNSAA